MFLSFYQINNRQDAVQFTEIIVPLITKWMGLPRTEYPYWACPYDMIYGNGFIEVDFPRVKEDGIHVVIPCLYYLSNFPKPINIGWGISVSEPNFMSDGV